MRLIQSSFLLTTSMSLAGSSGERRATAAPRKPKWNITSTVHVSRARPRANRQKANINDYQCPNSGVLLRCDSGKADPHNMYGNTDADCREGCASLNCDGTNFNTIADCLSTDQRTISCTYNVTRGFEVPTDMCQNYDSTVTDSSNFYVNLYLTQAGVSNWTEVTDLTLTVPQSPDAMANNPISYTGMAYSIEGLTMSSTDPVSCTPSGTEGSSSHISGTYNGSDLILTGFAALFNQVPPDLSQLAPYSFEIKSTSDLAVLRDCSSTSASCVLISTEENTCYFGSHGNPGAFYVPATQCAGEGMKECGKCVSVMGCSYCTWWDGMEYISDCGIPPTACRLLEKGASNTCGSLRLLEVGSGFLLFVWALLSF